jgi:hypothetical protein
MMLVFSTEIDDLFRRIALRDKVVEKKAPMDRAVDDEFEFAVSDPLLDVISLYG